MAYQKANWIKYVKEKIENGEHYKLIKGLIKKGKFYHQKNMINVVSNKGIEINKNKKEYLKEYKDKFEDKYTKIIKSTYNIISNTKNLEINNNSNSISKISHSNQNPYI